MSTKKHGNAGRKFTKEHKRKLSEARKKRKITQEQKDKLSKSLKGRNITWGDKISKALKGKETWMKGKCHTDDAKRKIRQGNLKKGNKIKRNLSDRLRKSAKYSEWRSAVYKRDNYNCSVDITHTERLNADHIIPFSKIMKEFLEMYKDITDQNKLYELAISYDQLWDINNGRTLCELCHRQTNTFGGKS